MRYHQSQTIHPSRLICGEYGPIELPAEQIAAIELKLDATSFEASSGS